MESRANAAYEHYRVHARDSRGRRLGAAPAPYSPPETPAGKINLTDPDSRMLKASRGYVQGYNAQAAVNENQIVIAAEVTVDSPDFGHLQPMLDAAQSELQEAGVSETPGVLLADAGYWHKEQMENVIDRGIQVLIPPDAGKRKGTRPGWDGGAYAHMRRVLSTELGRALYRKRQAMIEPVFGHTKFNRRIDRFQRRGQSRRTLGMAVNHRHPQSAEAPQPPDSDRRGLKGPRERPVGPIRLTPVKTTAGPHSAKPTANARADGAPERLRNSLAVAQPSLIGSPARRLINHPWVVGIGTIVVGGVILALILGHG